MSLYHGWKRVAAVAAFFVALWLCLRYLYPIFLPFLLGLAAALSAERPVRILQQRLHFAPGISVFAAVTLIWVGLTAALGLSAVLLIHRAASLAGTMTDLAGQTAAGITAVRDWALRLAQQAPDALSQPLTRSLRTLFSNGGGLLDRGAEAAFDLAGHAAQHLPGALMTLGTAVLSSYLICARLPALRQRISASPAWKTGWRSALTRLLSNAKSWLRAQLKLSAVTFAIVLAGFFLLGIRHKLALALLTALVDAIPLFGTGTVLVPWALVNLLSGAPVRAVGLLGVYVTALVTRSVLEPKLLGRQLGLDPLAALIALYTGFRLWGFGGMILAPILTVTARELCRSNS